MSNNKWFQGFVILLFCVSIILTLNVTAKPSMLEESLIENQIYKETRSDHKLKVLHKPIIVVKSIFPLVVSTFINRAQKVTEAERINKKYKKRLLFLDGDLNYSGKSVLSVQHFKALIEIADEKGLKIACINQLYCVIDGDYIYTYKPDEMSN